MKQVDEHKVSAFYFELYEVLQQLAEAHGLKVDMKSPKYPNTMAFTLAIKGYDKDAGDDFEVAWAENFLTSAKKLGIEPEFLGKMFEYNGKHWRFVGTKKRVRRYPFIIYEVNTNRKGNRYMALANKTFRTIYDAWKQQAIDEREKNNADAKD